MPPLSRCAGKPFASRQPGKQRAPLPSPAGRTPPLASFHRCLRLQIALLLLQAQKGPSKRQHLSKAELMDLAEASGLSHKPIRGDGERRCAGSAPAAALNAPLMNVLTAELQHLPAVLFCVRAGLAWHTPSCSALEGAS